MESRKNKKSRENIAGSKKHEYSSRSPHQTPNFMNPEFKFQQFKVLQSGLFFLIKQVVLAFLSVF